MINRKIEKLRTELLSAINDAGFWNGRLSSSAISTAVAITALQHIDAEGYDEQIQAGVKWLQSTMLDDGRWGDTPESPANMTATLLSWAALNFTATVPVKTEQAVQNILAGRTIREAVLAYYGKDLTFSVPILAMCCICKLSDEWNAVPPLPFELSLMPQRFYRFLNIGVVSYAIPALIAVGMVQHRGVRGSRFRDLFIDPALKKLARLQPSNGGFLEAAPLTGFVAMCLAHSGYSDHKIVEKSADFLVSTQRSDGAWAIDTDLAAWVTSLAAKALREDLTTDQSILISTYIKSNAFQYKHPFTGARAGGWGWSNLPGAVPDADDTAGALIALYYMDGRKVTPRVIAGLEWLMELQNSDGGIPTFCRGWGKLPFDRSSPDISAHTIAAYDLWLPMIDGRLALQVERSARRAIKWLSNVQRSDGSWIPLWFGDQDSADELSPVYGTAVVLEHLSPQADSKSVARGLEFLKTSQNVDGGWGGAAGVRSKITITSRVVTALARHGVQNMAAVDFLVTQPNMNAPEPIGLYFARLWYSEELYNKIFMLNALRSVIDFNRP